MLAQIGQKEKRSAICPCKPFDFIGGPCWNRTNNLMIKSHLLCLVELTAHEIYFFIFSGFACQLIFSGLIISGNFTGRSAPQTRIIPSTPSRHPARIVFCRAGAVFCSVSTKHPYPFWKIWIAARGAAGSGKMIRLGTAGCIDRWRRLFFLFFPLRFPWGGAGR